MNVSLTLNSNIFLLSNLAVPSVLELVFIYGFPQINEQLIYVVLPEQLRHLIYLDIRLPFDAFLLFHPPNLDIKTWRISCSKKRRAIQVILVISFHARIDP